MHCSTADRTFGWQFLDEIYRFDGAGSWQVWGREAGTWLDICKKRSCTIQPGYYRYSFGQDNTTYELTINRQTGAETLMMYTPRHVYRIDGQCVVGAEPQAPKPKF